MEKAKVLLNELEKDLENIDNNKDLIEFIDRNSDLMINKYIDLIIYDIDNGVEIERNKKAILLSMKGGN